MNNFFLIGNIVVGIIVLLIGFKIYNPYKGKNDEEGEANFYEKYGILLKSGGFLLLILSAFRIIFSFMPSDNQWTDQDKTHLINQCMEYASQKVSDSERVQDYCSCTAQQTMLKLDKKTFLKYQSLPASEFQEQLKPIVELCNREFNDI